MELTPHECRVLGVLVEKAQTTPGQYPMTVNAVITGCNQKSNRHPVLTLNEDRVVEVLDSLRAKGLVTEVYLTGSRVTKYRHEMRQALELTTHQVVVLAELMLRGPQTIGEIRGHATRMHPIESLEMADNILASLIELDPPLVARHAPPPGSRAELFSQLLCPTLHPIETGPVSMGPAPSTASAANTDPQLVQRIESLESQVARLTDAMESLARSLGEPSPFADE